MFMVAPHLPPQACQRAHVIQKYRVLPVQYHHQEGQHYTLLLLSNMAVDVVV